MSSVFEKISSLVNSAQQRPDFLNALFGQSLTEIHSGRPITIFGAGSLGKELFDTLRYNGIKPAAFCDTAPSKVGTYIGDARVLSPEELRDNHGSSLVVIAALRHRDSVNDKLIELGFKQNSIFCKDSESDLIYLYAMEGMQHYGIQNLIPDYMNQCAPQTILEYFQESQDLIAQAYNLLADDKSKELLVTKLALITSQGHFSLFCDFIRKFSEPYLEFGLINSNGVSEDRYYFHNDLVKLHDGEIYLDIGAYDGDTVMTFLEACAEMNVKPKRIHAFEPDSDCYERLVRNVGKLESVICHRQGIWSEPGELKFTSSDKSLHDQGAAVSADGNTTIEVTTVDAFLKGDKATFIKMDPGGNIIPKAIQGASETIRAFTPTLAIGAYHGVGSIFQIPLLVNSINPKYKLYLRHNTFHLCDTALFAIAETN